MPRTCNRSSDVTKASGLSAAWMAVAAAGIHDTTWSRMLVSSVPRPCLALTTTACSWGAPIALTTDSRTGAVVDTHLHPCAVSGTF